VRSHEASAARGVKLTYDDFLLFPDDGKRHELIDGRAAEILTDKHVSGVPELVIEIGSRGTRKRDETVKRRLYERVGIEEYWIVDPAIDSIRVFRRATGGFGRPHELSAETGDTLETPLLPGLTIPVARIFS